MRKYTPEELKGITLYPLRKALAENRRIERAMGEYAPRRRGRKPKAGGKA